MIAGRDIASKESMLLAIYNGQLRMYMVASYDVPKLSFAQENYHRK